MRSSPWLRLDPREVFFPWGLPRFDLAFIVAVLAGYLASMIESFGDALWWAVVTVTTVGFGDFVPVTATGRVLASGVMVVGIALIVLFLPKQEESKSTQAESKPAVAESTEREID